LKSASGRCVRRPGPCPRPRVCHWSQPSVEPFVPTHHRLQASSTAPQPILNARLDQASSRRGSGERTGGIGTARGLPEPRTTRIGGTRDSTRGAVKPPWRLAVGTREAAQSALMARNRKAGSPRGRAAMSGRRADPEVGLVAVSPRSPHRRVYADSSLAGCAGVVPRPFRFPFRTCRQAPYRPGTCRFGMSQTARARSGGAVMTAATTDGQGEVACRVGAEREVILRSVRVVVGTGGRPDLRHRCLSWSGMTTIGGGCGV
jgi:hypothetical protein